METHSSVPPNLELEVDLTSFSNLIDCPVFGYSHWDLPSDSSMPEDYFETPPATFQAEPFWDLLSPISILDHEQSQACDDDVEVENPGTTEVTVIEANSGGRGGRGKRIDRSGLSREDFSRYYHLPVTQAADELRIGQTLFKKRCREVGIPCWPHRKLKSLEGMIQNVQDLEENSEMTETSAAVEALKDRQRMLSNRPDLQLDRETLRLRKAFFRINYLKKRLARMTDSSPSFSNTPLDPVSAADEEDMEIPLKNFLNGEG